MNFLITGGSGFIGRSLIASLLSNPATNQITVISRNRKLAIDGCSILNNLAQISPHKKIDVVINLAGSPIDQRWNKAICKKIISSRVNTTQQLVQLITKLNHKPFLMLSASAIGYYQTKGLSAVQNKNQSASTFVSEVCQQWEQAAWPVESLGPRLCIMRLGVVLGKNSRAVAKAALPLKLGLGGKLGSGQQIVSWIHIQDVIQAMWHLIKQNNAAGIYNFVAPSLVSNAQFIKTMAKALNRPAWFTVPRFVIRMVYGQMGSELLLSGVSCKPERLLSAGYNFRFASLPAAMADIFDQ